MRLGAHAFYWFIVGWSLCFGSSLAFATNPCEPALDSGFFVGVSEDPVFSGSERAELIATLNGLYRARQPVSFGPFFTKTIQLAHGTMWLENQRVHYTCNEPCASDSLKPLVRKALGHVTRVLLRESGGGFVNFLAEKRVFSVASIRYYLSKPAANGLPAHRDGQVFQGVILVDKSTDLIGGNLFVQPIHPPTSISQVIDQDKFETAVFGGVSNWHGVEPMELNSHQYPMIARDVVSIGFNVGDHHIRLPKGYRKY